MISSREKPFRSQGDRQSSPARVDLWRTFSGGAVPPRLMPWIFVANDPDLVVARWERLAFDVVAAALRPLAALLAVRGWRAHRTELQWRTKLLLNFEDPVNIDCIPKIGFSWIPLTSF